MSIKNRTSPRPEPQPTQDELAARLRRALFIILDSLTPDAGGFFVDGFVAQCVAGDTSGASFARLVNETALVDAMTRREAAR